MRPTRNKPHIGTSSDDPGRIGWETAISGAWPLPSYRAGVEHTTQTDWCWCQPTIIDTLPDGRVIVHRRTADGPE